MSAPDPQSEPPVFPAVAVDGRALAALLERHLPALRRALAPHMPQRHQSVLSTEDVLQQTCIDAFHDISRFVGRNEAAFGAWLHTLARRNLLDAVRMLDAEKRGGRRLRIAPAAREDSYMTLLERLPGSAAASPSRAAARREACEALDRAVAALPKEYREVVRRFDLQGEPIQAVAAELGLSRGAAYMLRARAHRKLAELMGGSSMFFSRSA